MSDTQPTDAALPDDPVDAEPAAVAEAVAEVIAEEAADHAGLASGSPASRPVTNAHPPHDGSEIPPAREAPEAGNFNHVPHSDRGHHRNPARQDRVHGGRFQPQA